MEAPEKIYLEREKETDRIHHLWGRTPVISSLYEHIEYTRTDAFIEKVCKFLKDRIEHDSIDYPMATHWLIEDFKKHMEE